MSFQSNRNRSITTVTCQYLRENHLKIVLVAVLVLLSFFNLKTALFEQMASSGHTGRQLAHAQPNPKALYVLGLTEYLSNNDTLKAINYFTKALSQQSLYIPAFIRKAELLAEQEKTEEASRISNYIDSRAPNTSLWRWDRTMLAYSLDQYDLLAANLSWFVENNMGKRNKALILATSIWRNPAELVQRLGTHNSPYLLAHFIKLKDVEKSKYMWEVVEKNRLTAEAHPLWYTNFFIDNKDLSSAFSTWNVYTANQTSNGLIYNADFQQEITGAGFGWRLAKKQRKLLVSSPEGLTLHFNGRKNVKFNLHQLIPVTSGQFYSLSYTYKSEKLSTDQRPFWMVKGYNCEKFVEKGEMVEPNNDWTDSSIIIQIPETCRAVWLKLVRKESFHFDNKISGKLHIKNLTLSPASTKSPVLFE